jgi:hypothetical protein
LRTAWLEQLGRRTPDSGPIMPPGREAAARWLGQCEVSRDSKVENSEPEIDVTFRLPLHSEAHRRGWGRMV